MEEKVMEKNHEIEIDLKRIFGLLLNKAWLIAVVAVLCAVLAFVGTWLFVTPEYKTTVMFYVNNRVVTGTGSITSGDMSAARGLVESFAIILNTRETLDEVADYAGLDYTYAKLQGMVVAEAVEDTEILKVVVTSTDPAEAEAIADAITHVLPDRSSKIIDGSSVKIVTGASRPTAPSSPSYPTSAVIGFLVGMLLVVAVIVLQDIFDTTIREEEDVSRVSEHPILATVPDMDAQNKNSRYASYNGRKMDKSKLAAVKPAVTVGPNISFSASEAYKLLRTKILLSFTDERSCHVIGVTSSMAGEGKSLTAVNLSYSMAQLGKRVLLIDCDMRRPTAADKLSIKKTPGLSDYLSGQARAETLIQLCGIKEDESAFHVISAGTTPPNPMELLSSKKMEKTLSQLRSNYDYIILDLPPVGEVGDSLVVAGLTDGMLLVVRQDFCDRASLNKTVSQLAFVNCKVLGTVFNGAPVPVKGRYYKYSKRYASYKNIPNSKTAVGGGIEQ